MTECVRRCLPVALVAVASAWLSLTGLIVGGEAAGAGPGDYGDDAAPAIDALARGDFSAFLSARPVMGPFSILLRAPFAALAGDPLDAYRWGSFACLMGAGLLGLYLARLARDRGSSLAAQVALVGVCLINPLTVEALQVGHPEEILTAALAVGAVAVASQGHSGRAALLLGLAVASKQWAVIAILPALMALPSGRLRAGLGAAGIVLALNLPGFAADPGTFVDAQENVAGTTRFVDAWSAWYPFAGATPIEVGRSGTVAASYEGGSELIGNFAHPLIVLIVFAVPLALAFRNRRFGLSGGDAMALLALLALLRCALDPVNNIYYHEPLLLALAGWDALTARGLPVRALACVAIAALLRSLSADLSDPQALNAVYLAAVVPAGVAIAVGLVRRPHARPRRVSVLPAPQTTRAS